MPYNFNRLYEGMVPFHNGFRQKLRMLEMATPGSQGAAKSNVLNLIRLALSLCEHLEMHHMIEERHIFGHLAKRLPQFESGKTHEAEHAHMHAALEEMEEYLRASSKKLSSSKGALPPPAPMPIAASDGDAAGEGGERGVDVDVERAWPEDTWSEKRFAEMLHRLKTVPLPHLEAEETSLKEASIRGAGFTEDELRRIPL